MRNLASFTIDFAVGFQIDYLGATNIDSAFLDAMLAVICLYGWRKAVSSRQSLLLPSQGKILRKNGNGEQG
jgi:hypothetical protein